MSGRDAASLMAAASFLSFLLRLTKRLDVLRWDQPYNVTEPLQESAPMVRTATGFQHHLSRRQLAAEGFELAPG